MTPPESESRPSAPVELCEQGLTSAQVEESRRRHGVNLLTPPPRDPRWVLLLEKFEDPIIRILLVAAVIAIVAGLVNGHYEEGIGILVAIALATLIAFFNEYKANQEFDVLNQVSDDTPVRVIRDRRHQAVPRRDLVVGDWMLLEQGEEIAADADVTEAVSFQVNESSLTGESEPVTKKPGHALTAAVAAPSANAYPKDHILRGTFVSEGHGAARVTAVGDATEIGKTARAAAEKSDVETPLQKQLERLGRVIGVFGFGVAAAIFLALVARGAWTDELGAEQPLLRIASEEPEFRAWTRTLPPGGATESETPHFRSPTHFTNPVTLDFYSVPRHPDATAAVAPTTVEPGEYGRFFGDFLRGVHERWGDGKDPEATAVHVRPTLRGAEYYLFTPLGGGQWYFILIASVAVLAAVCRVWLPVLYDAMALCRRKPVRRWSWLSRTGFKPWIAAVVTGAVVFGVGVGLGELLDWLPTEPSQWIPMATAMELLEYFMVAVTIIVVSIPEGLPMSVTLSLAYSMRKMTATNNLVRRLHATETVGASTVICSDKTGTLTMNEMRVAEMRVPWLPAETPESAGAAWNAWVTALSVNTTAHLTDEDGDGEPEPLGNPTEGALLLWLHKHNADFEAARKAFRLKTQLTFSTERKFMATLGHDAADGVLKLYAKGAPEILLLRCGQYRRADGRDAELSDADRAAILADARSFQGRGMRTLGFAERVVAADEAAGEDVDPAALARGLVWTGFAAIADPVRPEVPPAMAACRRAGVRVKIVTGDTEATAREIARQIGLWDDSDGDDAHIGGDAFAALDDDAAREAARKIKVMSRARPLNKLRLVNLLQESDEVVAVTGDGTNDAPALNHADVGLAMGKAGTSVAKEAADIILLDDSFASIVNAVMWGRSLYANIQKFILFQLTINVAALGIALLGPFLGLKLPLTVTQMLWVNLIMDTFAALAFATEPPDWGVMNKPPRKPGAFIVTPVMTRWIFSTGLFFLGLFLVAILLLQDVFPMTAATEEGMRNLSIFFSAFVFLQFWNMFNARRLGSDRSGLTDLRRSRGFLLVMILIGGGQILMAQFGGAIFRTVPLDFPTWCWIILGTSPVLWIGEAVRAWRRMRRAPSA